MGVMSRRVLPVCGNLCVFCPSLRPRSRQPVKRYKKLIADIFPRNQVPELNDRKIGKLCEYASKNPLRIPRITENLERRFYKNLRHESFGSVNVALCIYRKLLSSCKGQMPLFANSLLGITQTLLEQTRADEMQILGCNTLVEFIDCQTDGTYTFNLEGFIPKLCQLAQEVGDDKQAMLLRSAGLQALSYMVRFMCQHSHLSMDFDKIISVVLENYMDIQGKEDDGQHLKHPSLQTGAERESKLDTDNDPTYWSKLCLYNMAKLAKEATTVRRVLESLFHNFDNENHWSSEKGVALSILMYLQSILPDSGNNSHLLLSILVKHLDHKNVAKKPILQIDIINITTQLAQNMKQQVSVAIVGAISDLIKHLRKCLQNSADPSTLGSDAYLNTEIQSAIEMCILQLSNKVGDVGPILDLMAVGLENISTSTTIIARTTISAVYQTAKLITSVPNLSYHKKPFPDGLFHQLLLAMAHPDHEIQIGAHSVFSMVLMPSMVSPWLDQKTNRAQNVQSNFFIQPENLSGENLNEKLIQGNTTSAGVIANKHAVHPYRGCSFTHALSDGKDDLRSLRLSSHQVSLLLSSIWVQATAAENGPANFEAMAHTYSIALLFTRSKTSNYRALVRCFQLAFSLRSISLDQEGGLQPSRRRSLFTLGSYMLIFSARACNIPDLKSKVKASLKEAKADPFLELVNDIRLQAACIDSEKIVYGSQEDEVAAMKSLSAVELDDKLLKETVIMYFITKFSKLSEDELSSIKKQLLQEFSPDDAYPSGPSLFMETPGPFSPLAEIEFPDFDEIITPSASIDDESGPEPSGSQSDRKMSLSTNNTDVLNVNQLLESVLETARQVASYSASSNPLSYDQIKDQCEALVTGKQDKMSVLKSFNDRSEIKAILLSSENEIEAPVPTKALEYSNDELKLVKEDKVYSPERLRLPPSSPYDKFLKAAGVE